MSTSSINRSTTGLNGFTILYIFLNVSPKKLSNMLPTSSVTFFSVNSGEPISNLAPPEVESDALPNGWWYTMMVETEGRTSPAVVDTLANNSA